MDNKRACASLLVLLGVVLLALAGPVAGGMKATFAGGTAVGDAAVLRRLMASSSMLEDSVAPELTVDLDLHRRILADGFIKPNVYNPNQPACLGQCAGRGKPYTGRGCEDVNHCPH
ncbi:hypothetical protein U9M48_032110 [Paspalum notatum var. saurae]|uniref:Uncharacterized protein n=1 Tax=Paspalum notatum var. saurae TaxID=547442 RepID=A0AAQ3U858_PASNO